MVSNVSLRSAEVAGSAENAVRDAFARWLSGIVRAPAMHGRFVNTLSMLEHIGSVKIACTQGGAGISAGKIQHLAEEARHAELLKKIALRIEAGAAPGSHPAEHGRRSLLDGYTEPALLAGGAARYYFARLDALVRCRLRDDALDGAREEAERREAAYLLVTLLVERRAAWLYPLYQRVVSEAGIKISVRSIIGEEDRHLADVERALAELGLHTDERCAGLFAAESAEFARLVSAFEAASENGAFA